MFRLLVLLLSLQITANTFAQLKWALVNQNFGVLPSSFNVYSTNDSINGKPFIAYYATAPINQKEINFLVDTTCNRRLTPSQFYEKNGEPLLVVNTTFFSFQTNKNVSPVVIKNKLVAFSNYSNKGKGRDSLSFIHVPTGVINFNETENPNIGWVLTDGETNKAVFFEKPFMPLKDDEQQLSKKKIRFYKNQTDNPAAIWKANYAIGGGPVLVQNNQVLITNNEESVGLPLGASRILMID